MNKGGYLKVLLEIINHSRCLETAVKKDLQFKKKYNSLIYDDWNKIKITPKLEADYQISNNRNFVDINGYNIPISDNGIEVEWWDNPVPRSELEAIIPETTETVSTSLRQPSNDRWYS